MSEVRDITEKLLSDNWVPVKGYEELYLISNKGDVFSIGSKKILKSIRSSYSGTLNIILSKNGYMKKFQIHNLMMNSFHKKRKTKQIKHRDKNKYNNNLENLEWRENLSSKIKGTDRRVNSGRSKKPVIQYDKNFKLIKRFSSGAEAARELKIDKSQIYKVCKQTAKSAGGFTWRYAPQVEVV